MKHFENKNIWIVGASSGLGEGLTNYLSAIDCTLILSSRREEELIRVSNDNKGKKAKFEIFPMDLANSTQIEECVKAVESKLGHIDILIQSGGISQRDTILNTSMEVQRRIMEVNYFGLIHLTSLVLPNRSGYSASKHALHGYFDAMRAEHHQHNIDVTLLCPGYVHTNISYNALMGNGEKQEKLDSAQANGLNVQQFSEIAVKAIAKKKEEVYIGGMREVMGIYLKRFFPSIFSRIIRKTAVT